MLDDRVLAADHEAEAAYQPEDAATGATVNVVDATLAGTLDIVAVVAVAAIDDDVPRIHVRGELVHGAAGDAAGTITHTAPGASSWRRSRLLRSIQERASPRPS